MKAAQWLAMLGLLATAAWALYARTAATDWQQASPWLRQWGWAAVAVLMPLNWGLEAKKWQLLVQNTSPISFKESWQRVLMGVSWGSVATLFGGDWLGRIAGKEHKKSLTVLLAYGHFVQSVVMFGFAAASCFFLEKLPVHWPAGFQAFSMILYAITAVCFTVLIWHPQQLEKSLIKTTTKWPALAPVLLISTARHLLFLGQNLVAFRLVDVSLSSGVLLAIINLIFVWKTLGAMLGFWGDIALRQLSALLLFQVVGVPAVAAAVATLAVWLINLFLPMLVGAILIPLNKK